MSKMSQLNKIELFEERDFKGASISLPDDVPDLAKVGFLEKASSLRITGDPWVVFTGKNYRGQFEVLHDKEYSSIPGLSNAISSLRIIRGGLYNPKIIVFEDCFYGGKSAAITEGVRSLKSYDMDNMVSSHQVLSGCWTLYQNENYQGESMVTLAGDKVLNYIPLNWNDKVSSLEPATP